MIISFSPMASLSILLSSPPLKNLPKNTQPIPEHPVSNQTHFSFLKTTQKSQTFSPLFRPLFKLPLSFTVTQLFISFPCLASESAVSSSGKIDIESVLASIDDFLKTNPLFVAGCTFIWLLLVPVFRYYLSKCKFIYAADAFQKLKDEPNSQLLDIREESSLVSLESPDLSALGKKTIQVQFNEGDEEGFVKMVKERFGEPEDIVVCVLDNFDGNSMKAAELLFKNGFKEAYAIKNGVRGKDGWLAIQEKLLPALVHIRLKNKVKTPQQVGVNGAANGQTTSPSEGSSYESEPIVQSQMTDNEQAGDQRERRGDAKTSSRSSSPYPNYPDMKPPSSPTPSKP